jgi:peptidyl-tRNA hydrolase
LLAIKDKEPHAVLSEKQQLQHKLEYESTSVDECQAKIAVSVEEHKQLSAKHETSKKDHDKVVAS